MDPIVNRSSSPMSSLDRARECARDADVQVDQLARLVDHVEGLFGPAMAEVLRRPVCDMEASARSIALFYEHWLEEEGERFRQAMAGRDVESAHLRARIVELEGLVQAAAPAVEWLGKNAESVAALVTAAADIAGRYVEAEAAPA